MRRVARTVMALVVGLGAATAIGTSGSATAGGGGDLGGGPGDGGHHRFGSGVSASRNPFAYGCGTDAVSVRTNQVPNGVMTIVDPTAGDAVAGYAYLMYSRQCDANWAQIRYDSARYEPGELTVWLLNRQSVREYLVRTDQGRGWKWSWTGMITETRLREVCGSVELKRIRGESLGRESLGCA
jgi:hypothetical protein